MTANLPRQGCPPKLSKESNHQRHSQDTCGNSGGAAEIHSYSSDSKLTGTSGERGKTCSKGHLVKESNPQQLRRGLKPLNMGCTF
ncbi:hypothetical protein ATANTOWER_012538 [Ataeniobius toweri]|uniref:Uncharacterized protein n=1 Tax=Ataeniobius toweri TaxID=208326 RepID=A0ABU7A6J0_9TELE|nr:hypothetical protein [Ataeniobius toweri]